jgi:chromosomal replication initiation ATPase DnaA
MISIKEYNELLTQIEGITGHPLTDSFIKVQRIQKLLRAFHKKHIGITIPTIKEIVANAYLLPAESLNIMTRTDTIKSARQMAMWFYYNYSKKSLSNIGLEFCDGVHTYSHCLVLFSVGKINDLCSIDKTIKQERDIITKDIEVYYKKVERKKEEIILI